MTKSLEDYIEEIHLLIRDNGQARVRDVARAIGVKMPSVVKAIAELKKLGLVTQEPYESIKLTEEGSRVATMVLERHTILKAFHHLFPNLFKSAFVFCASPKKRKADEKLEKSIQI